MIGLFRSQFGHVTRARLRTVINKVRLPSCNPPRRTIFRRRYKVKGPLTMVHVDGHQTIELILYCNISNLVLLKGGYLWQLGIFFYRYSI